ncbi:MAG: hypothetical protein NWF00_11985 [Candidatus Bathyarchaeota archaeon]|nr:hypothetical protein [Candidatus Bathyarchaeota archaeon]
MFGDGKRYIDPKKGLEAFGPCLYENRRAITSSIKIGIVGTKTTIDSCRLWIQRCQGRIPPKEENSTLFQAFPGFTKVFGCELLLLNDCIEFVSAPEIQKVLDISEYNQRVREAAKLFTGKLRNFLGRDPRPHVVICALPQEIINSCSRESKGGFRRKLTRKEKAIVRTIREYRSIGQKTLFPFNEEDLERVSQTSNLRRLIKAEAMVMNIPTQLAKPRTFKTGNDSQSQDEATRAWNFCVAIYYKAEGYPWKLTSMESGTCYVGVSFYRDPPNSRGELRSSVAQIFTYTGEGLVLKGSRAIVDKITKSPHLAEEGAFKLISDVLGEYKKQMHQLPRRLVVHKSSRFKPDELQGFQMASTEIPFRDFITIETRGIKFMRQKGVFPPLRGTTIQLGENNYLLYTKGFSPYLDTYPGLRVPTPIEVVEHHGDSSMITVCEEIFALTKMNWNSADFCIRKPITLEYANEVGKILAYVPEEVEFPRPEYRFYM